MQKAHKIQSCKRHRNCSHVKGKDLKMFCLGDCLVYLWEKVLMVLFFHQKHDGVASCVGDITCINGCWRNNPCLNGGTCNEICEPTSVRYNCSCPEPFLGKHCEIQPRSCQDYKAAGVDKSGMYKIIDNTNLTLQVFCDFNSEPGFAWNLIESFSLSNNHLFKVNILRRESSVWLIT